MAIPKDILAVQRPTALFNGADHAQVVKLPKGKWQVVARDGKICLDNTLGTVTSPEVQVSPRSALIMHR